ncbi:MAG: hypothetical protein K6G22_12305 [Lachnospiraceae bacterium]|nr:hypothetical protein [Lachnospiraceae bacterium]
MEDSFYGVLYGKDVKEDLRQHLTIFGKYKLESYDDLDNVCELANELNDFGCNNRISADGRDIGEGSTGIGGMTSDEIREFFE